MNRFRTVIKGTSGSGCHDLKVRKKRVFVAAWCIVALSSGAAFAATAPPRLTSVGAPDFHLAATFQAAGADSLFLDVATNPTVGTNGEFLDENITATEHLTAAEISKGTYSSTSRIDPGQYWAMLKAYSFSCDTRPTCVNGLSNIVPFTVPTPIQEYRGLVTVYRYLRSLTLGLRITPAGTKATPYRVCWTTAHGRKRCASGRVEGFSWFEPDSDQLNVRLRDMQRRTTFRWYVSGKVVAKRTATTIPG